MSSGFLCEAIGTGCWSFVCVGWGCSSAGLRMIYISTTRMSVETRLSSLSRGDRDSLPQRLALLRLDDDRLLIERRGARKDGGDSCELKVECGGRHSDRDGL